jgi:hypothetical protein
MSSLASSPVRSNPPAHSAKLAFSPELELVIACCSFTDSQLLAQEISARLKDRLDWQCVLRLAEHHNVMPRMYQKLREFSRLAASGVVDELRTNYELNIHRSLKFVAELFRILDCLQAHSIPAIPLKGPALAETAYGDVAARWYSDLDVLVPPKDVWRAKEALQKIGYVPALQLSNAAEHAYLATGYEYSFDGPAGRNLLEIQWGILPRIYAIDIDCRELFERSTMVTVSNRAVQALSAEDLVLVLCVHAAKHAWMRLCWLCDIAAVLQTLSLDWNVVEQRAKDLGIVRMVGVSLMLTQRLLDASVPDCAHQLWRGDRELERVCEKIQRGLPSAETHNPESLQYFWLMLGLRERWSDRCRFLLRLVFTPGLGEWQIVRLPRGLFALYRVIRIFRLVGRVLAVPFKFGRKNRVDDEPLR